MIRLSDVSMRYPTSHGLVSVFRDVNLQIEPGQKWGILGCNGAGKSTLVRLIGGAERPTSGRIERGNGRILVASIGIPVSQFRHTWTFRPVARYGLRFRLRILFRRGSLF